MYYVNSIKKLFSVIISSSILFFMMSNVVYSDDNKLGKLLRNIEKRLPVLEKQVETFAKLIANEKHRTKILKDFKLFETKSGPCGQRCEDREKYDGIWQKKKLEDMYVYKVYKKLKIPMEKMLICPKDLWWYDDSGEKRVPLNLLHPVTLSYLITGSAFKESYDGKILRDGILKNSKNINKLNEIVESLKTLQQIQYGVISENVEDEIKFPSQISQGDEYPIEDHAQYDLTGYVGYTKDCSKNNIKKWAKTKGSGQSILYLNMINNVCFNKYIFYYLITGGSGFPILGDSVVESTPRNYLQIASNLFSSYEEMGFSICEVGNDRSMSDLVSNINKFIEDNYEEEEEVDISDLDATDKDEESDDDELDLDDLKL